MSAPDDEAGQEAAATLRRGVEALSAVLAHVDRSHPAWRTTTARAALSTAYALVNARVNGSFSQQNTEA